MRINRINRQYYQHALRVLNEISEIEQISHLFANENEESVTLALEASFDLKSIFPVLGVHSGKFPIHKNYSAGMFDWRL